MLQFEFDIRKHKITHNPLKTVELFIGIILFSASILLLFRSGWETFEWIHIFTALFLLSSLYFFCRYIGLKRLFPNEYININSRKLIYKIGRGKTERKIYRRDIQEIYLQKKELIVIKKDKTKTQIDLSILNDQALKILINYLEIGDNSSLKSTKKTDDLD